MCVAAQDPVTEQQQLVACRENRSPDTNIPTRGQHAPSVIHILYTSGHPQMTLDICHIHHTHTHTHPPTHPQFCEARVAVKHVVAAVFSPSLRDTLNKWLKRRMVLVQVAEKRWTDNILLRLWMSKVKKKKIKQISTKEENISWKNMIVS